MAMLVLISIIPGSGLMFREKPIKVVWVSLPKGSGENIDLNLKESKTLPRSTIQQQKKISKSKGNKAKPMHKPSKKIAKKRKKKKLSPSERRMRRALAQIDKDLKNERGKEPTAAQLKNSGEGYKYGTSDKPIRANPDDHEYLKYQAMVRYKIINEWIVPLKYVEDENSNFNAKLEVMIDTDGYVISVRWAKTSGNNTFDASTIRAVKKASPFPKPPDKLAWEAYNEGFLVEFDPNLKH